MPPGLTPAEWDGALRRAAGEAPPPLLQSWAWGEVQARSGWRVERLRLLAGGVASVQLRGRSPFERAYVPRGPVPAGGDQLVELAAWARQRGLARLRVEPETGPGLTGTLRELGFRPAPQVQPQYTMIVKLDGDEEQTLGSFNRGTRYNIRLAAKRGVTVAEDADAGEMARQAAASASRQGIRLPQASYYQLLLELLPWCRTYVARVGEEAVAAIVVVHFEGRGYYMFSGANGRHRELKPVYLALWEAIRAAIREGCRDYDLWGVPPGPDRTHPWYGLWEFKSGFNGELVEYAGCWDLVLGEVRHGLGEASERARRSLGRLLNRRG